MHLSRNVRFEQGVHSGVGRSNQARAALTRQQKRKPKQQGNKNREKRKTEQGKSRENQKTKTGAKRAGNRVWRIRSLPVVFLFLFKGVSTRSRPRARLFKGGSGAKTFKKRVCLRMGAFCRLRRPSVAP